MCDTFVALSSTTRDGGVIFGKNSDREPNEAQSLEYHPARNYAPGETVQCTYLEIPQVKDTFAVILSRPFWMWGAEMGANEKGVVIGNEAVWSKMPIRRFGGLTGMDLLRLALERSSSAAAALETIVWLLSDFGQGGICGYEDKRMAYHNSFIIADPQEAWVLETAGELWAALKVKDVYSISNRLSIGETIDECHPELISTAVKKGWHQQGADFHFARSYADWMYTTFSASRARQGRALKLLDRSKGQIDPLSAFSILRDHQTDGYRPDRHLLGDRLCAHAANKLFRNATQTVGSFVAHLQSGCRTYWSTGTSSPCIGLFKPLWFGETVLSDIGPLPTGIYNPETLWWHHESFHRSVLLDFQQRSELIRDHRDRFEADLVHIAHAETPEERLDISRQAFKQARTLTDEWKDKVRSLPLRQKAGWLYRKYWETQNRHAKIEIT
jgi:dipeptidase